MEGWRLRLCCEWWAIEVFWSLVWRVQRSVLIGYWKITAREVDVTILLCRTRWGPAWRRWRCLWTKEKTQNSLGTYWFYVCVCLYTHTHTHTHTEGKDEPRFGACVMLWASWFCGKRCCSVFSRVQFEELAENSAIDMWEMEWNRNSCSGECSGNAGMELFCLMATETLLGRGKLFKD